MAMMWLTMVTIASATVLCAYGKDNRMFAFSTVKKESFNEKTQIKGRIPDWLQGYYIRGTCGSFGDFEGGVPGTYVENILDCIPLITQFKVNGSANAVTFTNKYVNSKFTDVWRQYGMNMTKSGVYYPTTYSTSDPEQRKKHPGCRSPKPVSSIHIGGDLLTWAETTNGLRIDPDSLHSFGQYKWNDNIGYPEGAVFFNNAAHEQIDRGGTMWQTTKVFLINRSTNTAVAKQAVYKIDLHRRVLIGDYTFGEYDLDKCSGGRPYPVTSNMPTYMHSFAMTENYIILPLGSYLVDPCALLVYRKFPLYANVFKWHNDVPSRFLIMKKKCGTFIKMIETKPFFNTHQVNAYEANGKIIMDMVNYKDSKLYDKYGFLKYVIDSKFPQNTIEKIIIRVKDWKIIKRKVLKSGDITEVGNINQMYQTKKYNYGYFVQRPGYANACMIKLNMNNGKENKYCASEGELPSEPIFVPSPTSKAEDDGILLVQGLDTIKKKAYLVILDARSMKEIAYATAPGHFSLSYYHSRFHSIDDLTC